MEKHGTTGFIQADDTAAGQDGGPGRYDSLRKGQTEPGCGKGAIWHMLQAIKGRLQAADRTVHGMPKLLFYQR
ncbi:hypothetical protein DK853_42335, partial [Klebsiella oxytoca]